MPRQAHGRSLLAAGPSKSKKRKQPKNKGLDALERAELEFPEEFKVRQHRLGQVEDDSDDNTTQARQDEDGHSAKRRKVDEDDVLSENEGSDPDGNPWHVGVEDDDEDSDLDSDEAFGESDEEKFADFTFRGSETTNKKSRAGNDGSEEEQDSADELNDEDDDFGDEGIDLAAAWDLDDEEQRRAEKKTQKIQSKRLSRSPAPISKSDGSEASVESGSEDDSEADDAEDDDEDDTSMAEEDVDPETTSRLKSFVDGLTPAERQKVKIRSTRAPQNLSDQPSQFGLGTAGISAADLMQFVKDPVQRQSLKLIQAAEKDEGSHAKGGVPGKLAVPLARRQQDRLDRSAAYDETKKTADRWVDTVKQNRRAEHVSFPLVDPAKASASAVKNFQPMSRAAPQTDLESKIQQIMVESGLSTVRNAEIETQEKEFEELQAKNIPVEEMQERQKELRMQRELMFREEVRAKRIKKIKSKAYRRVHRNERNKETVRERERLEAAGLINSDEERERNDRKRAEERMGARHKESRWAKAAKATGQTTWNDDARIGVSEMARKDEELRRRIQGKEVANSDLSASDSDSDDSDSETEEKRWVEKLDELDKPVASDGKSKLADMEFMKRAEASRKAENDAELRLLRRATLGVAAGEDIDSDVPESGRMSYGKRSKAQVSSTVKPVLKDFEEKLSEDEHEDDLKESGTVFTKTEQQANLPLQGSTAVGTPRSSTLSPTKIGAQIGKSGKSKVVSKLPSQSALKEPESDSENDNEPGLDDKDELAMGVFAGDDEEDLRKQFQKEKKQIVHEEGDQIIDNSLPGWGSWTGAGVNKKQQKKNPKLITTIKGIAPDARKDAKLDRVIVNEKRVKKNGKYLATELPHPFESRQQYERSLRLPMGPEWSTRNHFQEVIKPRVLLKQGQVIKPIVRPTA